MDITNEAVSSFRKMGISITLIVLVAAFFFIYFQLQQLKLTNLQIRQAEKDLNEDGPGYLDIPFVKKF